VVEEVEMNQIHVEMNRICLFFDHFRQESGKCWRELCHPSLKSARGKLE
jgi:hypothetical protein